LECTYAAPPLSQLRLFACKRAHNAFAALPTFCELREFDSRLRKAENIFFMWLRHVGTSYARSDFLFLKKNCPFFFLIAKYPQSSQNSIFLSPYSGLSAKKVHFQFLGLPAFLLNVRFSFLLDISSLFH